MESDLRGAMELARRELGPQLQSRKREKVAEDDQARLCRGSA